MEVVVKPCKTFRFNLASTASFNADFDGDISFCRQQVAALQG